MSWVESRFPPTPAAFRPYLSRTEGAEGTVQGLVQAVKYELLETLARPGRDREAAFHLLAADAYASFACEAAAEEEGFAAETLLQILADIQVTGDE